MSSVTLRPNGTNASAGTWTLTGGASGQAVTSDDSDASYTQSTVHASSLTLALGTHALGTSVTKQIRVRCRGTASGGATLMFEVRSAAGATLAAGSITSASITTVASSYAAVSLTATDVDGLQVWIYNRAPFGGTSTAYELYVDLVYVTIPTVVLATVTPDPYTASTIPAVSWAPSFDADGGDQTHYQLKVFDDATYGGGGFSADTSTPDYDSGFISSSVDNAAFGPIVSPDTYRVYLRVAQTVNGTPHWSAWTFDTFDLSVTTVDVSSVTAAADNANAKITVTVTRDAADGAWGFVEVERSTDGSVTWQAVRGATYVDPPLADTFVIDDYDVPNGTAAKYRARATYLSSGLPITSAWTTQSDTTTWTSTAVWFKVPGSPSLNRTFPFKVYPSATRPQRRGVFYVLGASRPVVVSDVRSSPEARCTVQTETEADATSLLAILNEPVVLIQAPTTMKRWGSRYCSIGDVSDDPVDPNTYGNSGYATWSFSAVEVDSPADPDAGTM